MSFRADKIALGAFGLTGASLVVGVLGAFAPAVEPGAELHPVEPSAATAIVGEGLIEIPEARFSISTDAELQARVEAMLAANRAHADAAVSRVAPLVEAESARDLALVAFGGSMAAPSLQPAVQLAAIEAAPLTPVFTARLEPQTPAVTPDRIVLAALTDGAATP